MTASKLNMLKVLVVFGTRPEAIKLAPVVKTLQQYPEHITPLVCVTAQHRSMLDQVLDLFGIVPDFDFDLMKASQTPAQVAAAILMQLEPILIAEKPDWLLIQGDTTTVMAATIVGFYNRVKIGHVEAGLRTHNKWSPFPEEINRRIAGVVADLHFAPTLRARRNLLAEGISPEQILVTGNTIVDAVQWVIKQPDEVGNATSFIPQIAGANCRLLLVTAHRRESFGQPIIDICKALLQIATNHRETVHIIFPAHLNPNVQKPVRQLLGSEPNITVMPPVDYLNIIHMLQNSHLVLTDSGGIQEEAVSLGKPVLVMREHTERSEAIDLGLARLVGTATSVIVQEVERLLTDDSVYSRKIETANPYGDGNASDRITNALLGNETDEFILSY